MTIRKDDAATHPAGIAGTPAGAESRSEAALSPLKRAFLALEEAQARLAAAEGATREPIAIIGLGCRVPGAGNPAELWNLLRDGRDAVGPIPRERFDIDAYFDPDTEVPGRIAVREAGFLAAVDQFDPGFFGISPREARGMDPQQRLLLEVAWEALEDAGQAPDRLSTSATGVYVGQAANDYAVMIHKSGDAALLDSHYTSGIAHSVTSGRLSYLLGLQGPSITVDTACSSSLVAVHLACQALRTRECRMALAGGVSLMLSEDIFIAFSHSRMLAPDGRCKTFDAAADGFGRAEGCGMVVLKRLSDAQADGDRILAVIRGSAVNQDGPSSGLTAPNGPAQEAVIRAALAQGGLTPHDIGCIEAHGTGTQLGDPLEVQALGHVFGPGRSPAADGSATASPALWLGSIKTNLGHLEAAAGVTGLIKLVLSLQHRAVPAHLHFRQPSPHMAWAELPFRIPTTLQPWEPIRGRRLGGVSSFGFSGTNVHVVVEQAPVLAPPRGGAPNSGASASPSMHLYTLSARSPQALRELASRHAEAISGLSDSALAAACYTVNAGRAQFAHRAAITARSRGELLLGLESLARGEAAAGLRVAHLPRRDAPRIAFAFTGQGSQYAGMAQGLYEAVPAFRAALDRTALALDPHLPRALTDLLFTTRDGDSGDDGGLLDRTEFTQPALFAVEVALAEMWKRFGIRPAIVIGHSVGEVAAACVAGVMSLDDAARLICARGRLMGALPTGGAMAVVQAAADDVAPWLMAHPQAGIAAVNTPQQTVIAGPAAEVEALCARFTGQGVRCQRLKVSHAFHSPLMEPMLDEFEAVVRGLALKPPQLRVVSNLSGSLATATELTSAGYWRRHVRQPVRFDEGVRTLLAQRPDLCIELGPQPTLLGFIASAARESQRPSGLASMRRGRPGRDGDREVLLEALTGLYLEGAEIDWRAVHEGQVRTPIALPSYPFERERCWFHARPAARRSDAAAPAQVHPLLGARLGVAGEMQIHEAIVSAAAPRWLAEHRVQHRVVVPATAYLDTLLAAAIQRHGPGADTLEDVTVQEAMLLPDGAEGVEGEATAGRRMQVLTESPTAGATTARVCSQPVDAGASDAWICHVTARLPMPASSAGAGLGAHTAAAGSTLAGARAACATPVDREDFYRRLASCGLDFGPAFHSVQQLWQGGVQALGEVALAPALQAETAGTGGYHFHPVLLDGCLQVMSVAVAGSDDGSLFMPLAIGRYRLLRRPEGRRCFAHVQAQGTGGTRQTETRRADLRIFDADGSLVAELIDVQLKRVAAGALSRLSERWLDDALYEWAWRGVPRNGDAALPTPSELATAAQATVESHHAAAGIALYDRFLPRFESWCARQVARTMGELGWVPAIGHPEPDTAALAARLGVEARHLRLFQRLLRILAEEGWLAHEGHGFVVRRSWAPGSPATPGAAKSSDGEASALLAEFPSAAAEIELTARVAREMAPALRGERDPAELLFPGGSLETAERLYRDSPTAHFFNGLMAEVVVAACASAPARPRPVRILELGAGTGGTTAHVLPRLPAAGVAYTFTDIGPLFVARARERFAAQAPFMRFATLDLELAPQAQGFELGSFDLVIASNVIHATADLVRTLARVRSLLAPGGALVMLEVTAPQRWFDLTVGLTEGWWAFTDTDLRPDYPTLTRAQWLALLQRCGFHATAALPTAKQQVGVLGLQSILLARAAPAPVARAAEPSPWLVVAQPGGEGEVIVEALRARGDAVWQLAPEALGRELRPRMAELRAAGQSLRGVLHAAVLGDDATDALDARTFQQRQERGVLSALQLAQELLLAGGAPPRLWLLTRRALRAALATDWRVDAAQAPMWGLGKALALEHPELRCVCIDVDETPSSCTALLAELDEDGFEAQVAIREGHRLVARLEPLPRSGPTPSVHAQRDPDGVPSWRLVPANAGSLDRFERRPFERRPPAAGEVEIEVDATGLNFKDVLNALGMYPGDPGPLGGECAGTVRAVGTGVTHLRPGDAVFAVARASFASHVLAKSHLVRLRPPGTSAEEAASFAIAYLTAQFCLDHLAGLRRGERVLVHAAAGGVGLAAVQLARRVGAEVLATAGSAAKRDMLRSLGVHHVFDSRSASFAEQVLQATGGAGVDVVLNSLSGDALIEASFKALARGGRFIEIGKRGIKSEAWVRALDRGIAYHVVDWGETEERDPALVARLLDELVLAWQQGDLPPLPRHVFDLGEHADGAATAWRFMAQARHVGRIVLRRRAGDEAAVRRDGSYLVTGGLSGIGPVVAHWLAEQGAGRLVLVGRRGAPPEAEPMLAALRARGVPVLVRALDVADDAALAALMLELRREGPPLRGVIHSAGVLADAGVLQQDAARLAEVFRPKVFGTLALEAATRADALDFFVVFSSVAAVLGSPGQSNHSAANAFLDQWAAARRTRGLPGLSINWGAWSDLGAAVDRGAADRMAARGLPPITPAQGQQALGRALMWARGSDAAPARSQVVVLPSQWDRYAAHLPGGSTPPAWLAELVARFAAPALVQGDGTPPGASRPRAGAAPTPGAPAATGGAGIVETIASAPASRRRPLMLSFVRERAMRALGLPAGREPDPGVPLGDLGLDSLLAVELRNTLATALGKPLPATLLFDHPTVDALTDQLLGELSTSIVSETAAAGASEPPIASTIVESIEDLSDEEVERLLASRARSGART